ncbi:MAG TPA: hypothetical protein VN648_30200, partial [Candidatus Methylomirabilis sp.]|nr:hypothetical protein [Candidatus Methylomirabilis sp.]
NTIHVLVPSAESAPGTLISPMKSEANKVGAGNGAMTLSLQGEALGRAVPDLTSEVIRQAFF